MPPGRSSRALLDDDVDEGHVDVVHARDAHKAQRGALGRVGRVPVDVRQTSSAMARPPRARDPPSTRRARSCRSRSHLLSDCRGCVATRGRVGRLCRTARRHARPCTTSKTGARSPTASAIAPKKTCRVVGLRKTVGVGGDGQHAQRREHAQVDAAAAAARHRRRRQDEDRGVAHDERDGARGGRVRRKSSANSWVTAPPMNRTAASRRSTSRATRTPSPTAVCRGSGASWPRPSTVTARAPASASRRAARGSPRRPSAGSASRGSRCVVSTVSSSVSATRPPVAMITASLTRGEALPSRLMAPSTSTSRRRGRAGARPWRRPRRAWWGR